MQTGLHLFGNHINRLPSSRNHQPDPANAGAAHLVGHVATARCDKAGLLGIGVTLSFSFGKDLLEILVLGPL